MSRTLLSKDTYNAMSKIVLKGPSNKTTTDANITTPTAPLPSENSAVTPIAPAQ